MTFDLQNTGKKTPAKKWVVGFNLSNNGSVCLLEDGEPILYLESERLTREKWDYNVSDLIKILPSDIKHIALADSYWTQGDKRLQNIRCIARVKKAVSYTHLTLPTNGTV